jgi:hypothetical protein
MTAAENILLAVAEGLGNSYLCFLRFRDDESPLLKLWLPKHGNFARVFGH